MAKEYYIWLEIEEYDPEPDKYTKDFDPVKIATAKTEEEILEIKRRALGLLEFLET